MCGLNTLSLYLTYADIKKVLCASLHRQWHQTGARVDNSFGKLHDSHRLDRILLIRKYKTNGNVILAGIRLVHTTISPQVIANSSFSHHRGGIPSTHSTSVTCSSTRFAFIIMKMNQSPCAINIFIDVNWERECSFNSNFLIRLNLIRANHQLVIVLQMEHIALNNMYK